MKLTTALWKAKERGLGWWVYMETRKQSIVELWFRIGGPKEDIYRSIYRGNKINKSPGNVKPRCLK